MVKTHVPVAEMPLDTGRNYGWHSHTCEECGEVWGHDGASEDVRASRAVFHAAHSCPSCGNLSDAQYYCRRLER